MTEPIEETEVVDMDELSNQELDLDENPIDLTKDNPSTTQFPDNDSSR